MKTFLMLASLMVSVFFQTANAQITYTQESDGVLFNLPNSAKMKVQVCTDKIIRILYTLQSTIPAPESYIVVKKTWEPTTFTVQDGASAVSISTATVKVDVSKTTGAISYYTKGGTLIMEETAAKTLTKKMVGTTTAYEGTIPFNSTSDEGIYGFGQFQSGILNQRGLSLDLTQHNQTDCSPFFMSTRGFGVLWINYSKMTVVAPLTLWSNWVTNDAIDYYFIYGPEFDNIIASYRVITGPTPLWPKWAYGFWQCKNFYSSQDELLSIVRDYRSRNYPIDNIVQDWQYYPQGFNGCQCFDATRYPNPARMIKTLHDSLNCHFTISVWPSYTETPGNTNFNFMDSRGYLLSVSDYLGRTYDAFNDSATYYYWKFINDSLVTKDVDGFWPDATEPESYNWANCQTAQGPAAKVENLFPLLHSKTLYDGYRSANKDKKRVCNLTRSYYAGSQRLAAAYWTGDINTDFPTFSKQVPAGLNVCMTGLPLFCTDVGGFWGDNTAEVETRWFQWGAFNPVFRVHGTRTTNELWSWGASTEAILASYSKLRYRLFPYVYSLAWKVTSEGYTMMRGLPFDFVSDPNVRDKGMEFMFGPAFLVCPVTTPGATTVSVYFPASSGTWYDFWTGDTLTAGTAGRTITAQAPIQTMPLYIRAGSIVPMGPAISYADTVANPIELRVYTGANGEFTLYEDEGDGYAYEKGAYATIKIEWNDATNILTFQPRFGSFPGMLDSRTFNVVWVNRDHGTGGTVTTTIDKSLTYSGGTLCLNKITGEIGVIRTTNAVKRQRYTLRIVHRRLEVVSTEAMPLRIELFDPRGRLISEKWVEKGMTNTVTNKLIPGVYIVSIRSGNGIADRRRVIVP
jgi:alpha-D-xyloside xylohydrolase